MPPYHNETERLLQKGSEAISHGEIISALSYFERALHIEESPVAEFLFCFLYSQGTGPAQPGDFIMY